MPFSGLLFVCLPFCPKPVFSADKHFEDVLLSIQAAFLFSGLFTKFSLQSAHADAILKLTIIWRCHYVFSERYLLEMG